MSKLVEILSRYQELCDFCDTFWRNVFDLMPEQCACASASGCSTCCELQSVTMLEAFVIADYCRQNSVSVPGSQKAGPCPFLSKGRCRIYPARPLICRTHGLLLKGDEFAGKIVASCPFNFTKIDYEKLPESLALDADKVTEGLARLNAALCITLFSDAKEATTRIALADLANGTIGPEWFSIL
jgi:Fe-S-cluster containining protein